MEDFFVRGGKQTTSPQLMSIVVPTHNQAQYIAETIESILSQKNCNIEILFIDAESTDRTVEIIRSYEDSRMRIQTVPTTHIFEMINRGIAISRGDYVNILIPQGVYLYPDALSLVMHKIEEFNFPDLFLTASLCREETFIPELCFNPYEEDLLKKALQPTFVHAFFVKRTVFQTIGYFDPDYLSRGVLDFLIRFFKSKQNGLTVASEQRVYVDATPIYLLTPFAWTTFKETFLIIKRQFGLYFALSWFFTECDIKRLVKRALRKCWEFSSGIKQKQF